MIKNFEKKVRFNLGTLLMGHYKVTYRGIEAFRCPFDYTIYQMILSEIQPDLVIEIGTYRGGGALYVADLMELMGKGMVHTIDMQRQSDESIWENKRIKCFTNGWENYDLKEAEPYKKILVIEDSSHTYENTLGVIKKFAPVVSKDSYLIVEDGIVAHWGGLRRKNNGGPVRAIKEFFKGNDDFIIDRHWCDFFGTNATFNVNGYLLKVN